MRKDEKILLSILLAISAVCISVLVITSILPIKEADKYSKYSSFNEINSFNIVAENCDNIYMFLFNGDDVYKGYITKNEDIDNIIKSIRELNIKFEEKVIEDKDTYGNYGDTLILNCKNDSFKIQFSFLTHNRVKISGDYCNYLFKIESSTDEMDQIIENIRNQSVKY